MKLEFTVYATNLGSIGTNGPMMMAQAIHEIDLDQWTVYEVANFRPLSGSAADYHRVQLSEFTELPERGWMSLEVGYTYNYSYTVGPKPLTFYTGEPTDWPTGLVSFSIPVAWTDPGKPQEQGPVFTVAVRRMA